MTPEPLTDREVTFVRTDPHNALTLMGGQLVVIERLLATLDAEIAAHKTSIFAESAAVLERDRLLDAATQARVPEGLDALPRLWWCSAWQTLNEKRYHGNEGPCSVPGGCGQIAYVRDSDLAAAYNAETRGREG